MKTPLLLTIASTFVLGGGYDFIEKKECKQGIGYYVTYTMGKRTTNKSQTPIIDRRTMTFQKCKTKIEKVMVDMLFTKQEKTVETYIIEH